MVLPDNVLFEENAGRDVRQLLMKDCQMHTILRLPVGTFTPYSTGVKANVLFFRKVGTHSASDATREGWVYDLRTNVPKVTKTQPLTDAHFAGFVAAYGLHSTPRSGDRQETERFHCFSREAIADRNDNLDIVWLRDESLENNGTDLEPEDLLGEAITQLQTAMDAINELAAILGNGKNGQ